MSFHTTRNSESLTYPKRKTLANLLINKGYILFVVAPLGLEPRTHTLKVYCSTN